MFGLVVAAQLVAVVAAYVTPQKPFGYQMFPESSEWRADIVRVAADGSRRPIDDGTWEYDWSVLVPGDGLAHPGVRSAASRGASSTVDLFAKALDWVAANTPRDVTTSHLEATVTVWRNDDPVRTTTLRSQPRGRAP